MHEYVYLTVTAEKDTVLGFLIHTKQDEQKKHEKQKEAVQEKAEAMLLNSKPMKKKRTLMQEKFLKGLMKTTQFDMPTLTRGGGGSGIVNFKYDKGNQKSKVVQTQNLLLRLRDDVTKTGANNVIKFIVDKRHKRQFDRMPEHSKKHKEFAFRSNQSSVGCGKWFEAEDIMGRNVQLAPYWKQQMDEHHRELGMTLNTSIMGTLSKATQI